MHANNLVKYDWQRRVTVFFTFPRLIILSRFTRRSSPWSRWSGCDSYEPVVSCFHKGRADTVCVKGCEVLFLFVCSKRYNLHPSENDKAPMWKHHPQNIYPRLFLHTTLLMRGPFNLKHSLRHWKAFFRNIWIKYKAIRRYSVKTRLRRWQQTLRLSFSVHKWLLSLERWATSGSHWPQEEPNTELQ